MHTSIHIKECRYLLGSTEKGFKKNSQMFSSLAQQIKALYSLELLLEATSKNLYFPWPNIRIPSVGRTVKKTCETMYHICLSMWPIFGEKNMKAMCLLAILFLRSRTYINIIFTKTRKHLRSHIWKKRHSSKKKVNCCVWPLILAR